MRTEAAVTSISWIPSEAIAGATKLPFESGIAHYDAPTSRRHRRPGGAASRPTVSALPTTCEAWIEVKGGRIVDYGQSGHGLIGSTTLRLGSRRAVFEAVALPDLQPPPLRDG